MTAERWFDGRVAIVTGGGNGMGRAHVLGLARHGVKIIVNDLGGEPDGSGASHTAADAVVEAICAVGGQAVANHDSVTDPATGARLVECAMDHFGRIDVVIPSAGIIVNNRFEDMTGGGRDVFGDLGGQPGTLALVECVSDGPAVARAAGAELTLDSCHCHCAVRIWRSWRRQTYWQGCSWLACPAGSSRARA